MLTTSIVIAIRHTSKAVLALICLYVKYYFVNKFIHLLYILLNWPVVTIYSYCNDCSLLLLTYLNISLILFSIYQILQL